MLKPSRSISIEWLKSSILYLSSDCEGTLLSLESRNRIYNLILAFPGLHFREIQRRLRTATGALEYHLGVLTDSGAIESRRYGQFRRFYPKGLHESEASLLSVLRHERQRNIVIFLSLHPHATHTMIAKQMRLSASTVSWYLRRLKASGVVRSEKDGRYERYIVSNPVQVGNVLRSYKPSFLDKAVNNFLSMWDSVESE